MDQFKIISPLTGRSSVCDLEHLSRYLLLDSYIVQGDRVLGLVTHSELVFFAHKWAVGCSEQTSEGKACLHLVEQWLADQSSVSSEQLRAYARAVTVAVASDAAAYAAYAATYSAYAAAAANGAHAANAAHSVADAAADAAARYAVAVYKQQGEMILEFYEEQCVQIDAVA